MRYSHKNLVISWALLILTMTFLASRLAAQTAERSEPLDEPYTGFIRIDYGLTTYKSAKLVESNDTGGMLAYVLSANVGADKVLNIEHRVDSSTIAFALNTSSIASSWSDTAIRYRWGYLTAGLVLGTMTMKVNRESTALYEGSGSGFGGSLSLNLPISPSALFRTDVSSVSIAKFTDIDKQTVTIGPRMDVDLGAIVTIYKRFLSGTFGYRYRTYSVTYDSVASAELHTSTYVGLLTGIDF